MDIENNTLLYFERLFAKKKSVAETKTHPKHDMPEGYVGDK